MRRIRGKLALTLFISILLISAFIIHGCKQEFQSPNSNQSLNKAEVQEAERWYNDFTRGKPQSSAIFSAKLTQVTPVGAGTPSNKKFSTLNVDWTKAEATQSGNRTIIEVPVQTDLGFTTTSDKFNKDNPNPTTSLVVLTSNNGRSAYFMSVISEPGYKERVTYTKQPKTFTGSLIYHSLQGQFIAAQQFKNGAVVGVGVPTNKRKSLSKSDGQVSPMLLPVTCDTYDVFNVTTVCIQGYSTCYYTYDYLYSYTVCYDPNGGGGGIGGGGDTVGGGGGGGGGTTPTPTPTPPCIPPSVESLGPVPLKLGYGVNVVNPNDPGQPTPTPTPPPVPCVDPPTAPTAYLLQVKTLGLKTCTKNLYDTLATLTSGMNQIFTVFKGPASSGFNWNLTSGTLPASINATTTDNRSTKTATTTFDEGKYTNATDLALARTILHEAAHAYLVRYFATNPAAANKDYKALLDLWNDNNNLEATHHEVFVTSFVQKIATSLAEYGDSKGYKFTTATEKTQFYENMAWGGLEGTAAFGKLSATKQASIANLIRLEQFNTKPVGSNNIQKGTRLSCNIASNE